MTNRIPATSPRPQANASLPISEEAIDALDKASLVLIDLDGCLAFGGEPHPQAAKLIGALDGRYVILSNNSTETPKSLARQLNSRGLLVQPSRMLLAGCMMIDLLAERSRGRDVALFAVDEIQRYALAKGLHLVSGKADTVALARDTAFDYAKLQRIAHLLADGASLIAANPDMTHPGADRRPVVETGALLAAVRACAPSVVAEIIGKPSPVMFQTAMSMFDGDPAGTIMIGDNPLTDGEGAKAAGIRSMLVGPGNPFPDISAFVKG